MRDSTADVKLLTMKDAAGLLAISVRTLWRLIAAGELQAVRIGSGRTVRIRLADVHRLVNGGGA